MAPFSRVYDLSENVVPAQGAEAIADTPAAVSPTTTTDRERRTDETDVTSLDSNKFTEQDTRTPENRVDVTTLSSRRQHAKRSVPVPRLSANEFSSVLHYIDRVASQNPQERFDRLVTSGVQSYCYRTNQNALNVLAAVVPTLINSGNFDVNDQRALRSLAHQVQTMRHQADGSMGDAGSMGDGTGGTGGVGGMDADPIMGPAAMAPPGSPAAGGDPAGAAAPLSGPGGADGTAGQPPAGGGGLGGALDGMGSMLGDMFGGGGNPSSGGPAPDMSGAQAGGLTMPMDPAPGGAMSGPPGGAPGAGDPSKGQPLTSSRAPRLAKMILSGQIDFFDLTKTAQDEVRRWVKAADDDGGSPTTDAAPGQNENDQDNRQNPHNDGANSDSMVGDTPEYANLGGGGSPDVDPNWKGSSRQRRRLADSNRDVAEKDTNRIDVTAPNADTSDRAQQSQYDRSEYDQNGPILDENGPSADKSTDQNWPPKASSVDAMRLADLYVAMNMVPAEKKYEIVAGFENMNSWIVKDRLKVLGYVQKIASESQQRQQRTRSMVPQSNGQQQSRGGMPSMGRAASIRENRNNGVDQHFLAL